MLAIWMAIMAMITPPALPFECRGVARDLFHCKDAEVLIDGPAGTGKSRAVLERIYHDCEKWPGLRVLMARKWRSNLAESVLVTWEDHVLPAGHECLDGNQRSGRHKAYKFNNGSTVVPFGFDDREKIKSTEFDEIYVNEATEIDLEDWEYAVSRLRGKARGWSQAIADCNPGAPNHWLLKRTKKPRVDEYGQVVLGPDGKPVPMMTRFVSRHTDNPLLWDAKNKKWTRFGANYIAKLQNLSGTRRDRLLLGLWVAAEGAVFQDCWDERIHMLDAEPHKLRIKRYIASVDWGYRAPFVLQLWGIDRDGTMIRVREIYRQHRTDDWCRAQAMWMKQFYGNIEFICDPEDAARIAAWRAKGIRAIEAIKGPGTVVKGVHDIEDRLKPVDGGPPSLFMLKNVTGWYSESGEWITGRDSELLEVDHPTSTEEEMTLYSYAKDAEGRPLKEQPPVDMYDHGIDAMRYAEFYLSKRERSILMPADNLKPYTPDNMGQFT